MFDIVDLPDSGTIAKLAKRYPMLEIPALETWLTLMRVSGDCLDDLDRFLARHNLSQRKFFVLILLMRNPDGLKVSQLAAGTGVSCATMTGVVDGLLNAKLLTRETDEQDRRAFVVTHNLCRAGITGSGSAAALSADQPDNVDARRNGTSRVERNAGKGWRGTGRDSNARLGRSLIMEQRKLGTKELVVSARKLGLTPLERAAMGFL